MITCLWIRTQWKETNLIILNAHATGVGRQWDIHSELRQSSTSPKRYTWKINQVLREIVHVSKEIVHKSKTRISNNIHHSRRQKMIVRNSCHTRRGNWIFVAVRMIGSAQQTFQQKKKQLEIINLPIPVTRKKHGCEVVGITKSNRT